MTQFQHEKLSGVKAFVLDMDGTVFLSEQLLPGARDFGLFTGTANSFFIFDQ